MVTKQSSVERGIRRLDIWRQIEINLLFPAIHTHAQRKQNLLVSASLPMNQGQIS